MRGRTSTGPSTEQGLFDNTEKGTGGVKGRQLYILRRLYHIQTQWKDILNQQTRTIYLVNEIRPCVGLDLSPLAPEATSQGKILGLATERSVSKPGDKQPKSTYMVTPGRNKRVNSGSTETERMTHALRG